MRYITHSRLSALCPLGKVVIAGNLLYELSTLFRRTTPPVLVYEIAKLGVSTYSSLPTICYTMTKARKVTKCLHDTIHAFLETTESSKPRKGSIHSVLAVLFAYWESVE